MASLNKNTLPQIAFIVGMGRSGTTLLTNMLNSNPEIISTPENEFILFTHSSFENKNFALSSVRDGFNRVFNYDYNNVLSIWRPDSKDLEADINALSEKNFANVCKLVYMNYPFAGKDKGDIRVIVDKNPSYSLHLNVLRRNYQDARYIILVRDFRDNVLSRKTKSEKNNSIGRMAEAWNLYYENIYSEIEKHKLDTITIRYEDLVADPEKVLSKVCSFLNVVYSDSMLEFQTLSKRIKAHIKESAAKEVFDKIDLMHSNLEKRVNSDRVKAYEQGLTKEEIDRLNYTCRVYGYKFGYLSDEEVKSSRPNLAWKLADFIARVRLRIYFLFSNVYYSLPVSLRLMMLKKRT